MAQDSHRSLAYLNKTREASWLGVAPRKSERADMYLLINQAEICDNPQ